MNGKSSIPGRLNELRVKSVKILVKMVKSHSVLLASDKIQRGRILDLDIL